MLLPVDPNDNVSGLAHLYEHVVVDASGNRMKGFTTEDYIFLFSRESDRGIVNYIWDISINEDKMERRKRAILTEIDMYEKARNEAANKIIWRSTKYEPSPLGQRTEFEKISINDIQTYIYNRANQPVYIYKDGDIEIIRPREGRSPKSGRCCLIDRFISDLELVRYIICRFYNNTNILFLIQQIIEHFNAEKIARIFDKASLSALVLQVEVRFPEESLIEKEKTSLLSYFKNLKTNMSASDRAFSELVSIYYYGVDLEERINEMNSYTTKDILDVISQVSQAQ